MFTIDYVSVSKLKCRSCFKQLLRKHEALDSVKQHGSLYECSTVSHTLCMCLCISSCVPADTCLFPLSLTQASLTFCIHYSLPDRRSAVKRPVLESSALWQTSSQHTARSGYISAVLMRWDKLFEKCFIKTFSQVWVHWIWKEILANASLVMKMLSYTIHIFWQNIPQVLLTIVYIYIYVMRAIYILVKDTL